MTRNESVFYSTFYFFLDGLPIFEGGKPIRLVQVPMRKDLSETKSYEEVKQEIVASRKQFSIKYIHTGTNSKKDLFDEIKNYWVNTISNDLYQHWKNTPWDFNGSTTRNSAALSSSKSRWVVSLTNDKYFLQKWLSD